MKKLMKLFLLALVAMLLVSCANETKPTEEGKTTSKTEENEKPTAKEDKKVYKIGVSIYQFNDNFMTLYREELQKHFAEVGEKDGVTYELDIQDGKNDQPTQTEHINNFIAQGKDLLILNLVDPTGATSIFEKAKAANIPVILINREPGTTDMTIWPGKTTYVGADATQSGTYQGEIIAATPNKGDINGDGVISYIMIMGDPQNVDAQQRTDFSILALDDAGLKHKALAEPYQGNWDQAKGQEFAATALAQFGKDLEVVFSNNDGMAMGALTSIEAAGRKVNEDIYLVGVDAIAEAQQALAEGRFTGTVLNDHFNQSHTVVEVAKKLLAGEEVSNYYWHDYVKVTKPEDAELVRKEYREETVEQAETRYKERDARLKK